MIAIDTNVLVRYLAQDDPEQGALASDLFAGLTRQSPGFVSREVLVELVWVLERSYGFNRMQVVEVLAGLVSASELEIETSKDVGRILQIYATKGFGFSDLMIYAAAQRQGADRLMTFDQKAARMDGVELLGAGAKQ